jgi:hypothetical protein
VEQFEAGVRRRFEKLNTQMFGQEVVGGGQEGVRLDHLYETISVMSGAFVETTQGGNVSVVGYGWFGGRRGYERGKGKALNSLYLLFPADQDQSLRTLRSRSSA